MADLTEDEERWYWRAAKSIASAVKQTYEKDWMGESNCLDDDTFLVNPNTASVPKLRLAHLEFVCKQCPVSMQCMEWADKHNPTGVFIAGEWRQ